MKATITGITSTVSRLDGSPLKMVFLKGEDCRSYKTYLTPSNGNYKHWSGVLAKGNSLDGLKLKAGNIIDADSFPTLISKNTDPITGNTICEVCGNEECEYHL